MPHENDHRSQWPGKSGPPAYGREETTKQEDTGKREEGGKREETGRPDATDRIERRSGFKEQIDPCRTRPAAPFLVIRSWPNDLGLRPTAPEDAAAVFFSPDVTLRTEEDPVSGVVRTVPGAWVTNLGLAPAAPVQVEFFFGAPSLTFPTADLTHYATEHTVIPPQSSARVDARPVSGILQVTSGSSLLARCSTPLDPRGPTNDPRIDRHVAVLMFGQPSVSPGSPPDPDPPVVDFLVTNWLSSRAESRVEIAIDRLLIPRGTSREGLQEAIARYGAVEPDLARHLEYLEFRGVMSRRRGRRILRSRRGVCPPADTVVRRSPLSAVPEFVHVEAELFESSRRAIVAGAPGIAETCTPAIGASTLRGLPAHRAVLRDRIVLEPFEARTLRVAAKLRESLRDDETAVVHLFHVGTEPIGLLGRYALVLPRSKALAT